MGAWRFTNITQGSAPFWPTLPSISIKNNQPCEIATLDAEVVDPGADQTFEEDDELLVEYAPGDGGSGDTYLPIFAGDLAAPELKDVGRSDPRIYGLQAQDFTKRLHRNVIDANRKVEESASARIAWIMSFCTQGITTAGVETISDLLDPRDYRGMHVDEALADVASELGASFYVDFDKALQFFVTIPTNPAPFDLELPSSPPASYPYRMFSLRRDNIDRAEAVYVQGDGVAVWVGTRGGRETSYADEAIKTVRKAQRVGARILADLGTPLRTVRLELDQPGLLPTQTTHLVKPSWAIAEDFVVQSVEISAVDPNATGGRQLVHATLGDRFTHCYLRAPSAKDNAQENTGDDDDGSGDTECIDCQRVIAGLPAAFGDPLALAFGGSRSVYTYDGATMSKHTCGLGLKWQAEVPGSDVYRFGHEPGSETPVLAFPYGIAKEDGSILWDRSAELEAVAATPMDRPRFWAAGEGPSGGGGDMPFGGYGTFDLDFGPTDDRKIIWRCYMNANPGAGQPLKIEWAAGEIYKGIRAQDPGLPGESGIAYGFANMKWFSKAGWTDPDDPPTDADILDAEAGLQVGTVGGTTVGDNFEVGGSYATTYGPVEDEWVPINAGSVVWQSGALSAGRWIALVLQSEQQAGPTIYAETGAHLTFTMSDNGTSDSLDLECDPDAGGGGATGPVLQARNSRTGALISSIDLEEVPAAMRAAPNAQHVWLLYADGATLERYDRDPALEDTLTIAGFGTGLQDWAVDDDHNVYRLAGEELTKYNRDGDELWTTDLNAAEGGYTFPTGSAGYGQVIVDEHVRIIGISGAGHALLLTVGRPHGNVRSAQRFKSDGDAIGMAVGRNSECLVIAGSHDGADLEDEELTADRWLMRLLAVRAE